MRKLISFFHISLDGYVAGPHGEMNWIKIDQELFNHIGQRISQGDTAMYGRVTYQMMENYWPTAADKPNATKHDIEHSKWYKDAHKLVLSHTIKDAVLANTTVISDHLADRIHEIKNSSGNNQSDILVFGSPSATHALIKQDLIDGFWLFVNPIVLGHGIPLFTKRDAAMKLQLISTKTFQSGVTELNYVREKF